MSARNLSRSEANRIIPSARMSQKEMDDACRRLSRVPNKNAQVQEKNDGPDNYAIEFFSNHPDLSLDKRSPQEKLDEINSKLTDMDLEEDEKLNALVQKKAICSLAFGDNSPESYEALSQLGAFYNEQNRPESAIRHLQKAEEISESVGATKYQKYLNAVEMADAYLAIPPQNKAEKKRNVTNAENCIKKYTKTKTDDKFLIYRRRMIFARIKVGHNKYADAFSIYEKAYEDLDAALEGKPSEQIGSLFIEMGKCAEKGGDPNTAKEMYQRAHDTFIDLEMSEAANLITPKIKSLERRAKAKAKEEKQISSSSSSHISLNDSNLNSGSNSSSASQREEEETD